MSLSEGPKSDCYNTQGSLILREWLRKLSPGDIPKFNICIQKRFCNKTKFNICLYFSHTVCMTMQISRLSYSAPILKPMMSRSSSTTQHSLTAVSDIVTAGTYQKHFLLASLRYASALMQSFAASSSWLCPLESYCRTFYCSSQALS